MGVHTLKGAECLSGDADMMQELPEGGMRDGVKSFVKVDIQMEGGRGGGDCCLEMENMVERLMARSGTELGVVQEVVGCSLAREEV